MTLQSPSRAGISSLDLLRVVLVVVVAIALMLILTWFLGADRAGPSYQIVPDPAGLLPY